MRKNFYLSLLIIFITSACIFTAGYNEGADFLIISYFFLFVYRILVKIIFKNKKFYASLVEKLSKDKNLERKFIILCIAINIIHTDSLVSFSFSDLSSTSRVMHKEIIYVLVTRYAAISTMIHVFLLLKSIREKEKDMDV